MRKHVGFLLGFTLIELLITISVLTALIVGTVLAINPARHLAKARNTQRNSDINQILFAIFQNMSDNRGVFTCANGSIPTSTARMATTSYNIGPCLVPDYLPTMPFDPATSGAHYVSLTNYDTAYTIVQSTSTGRVTISAPAAELSETVSLTR